MAKLTVFLDGTKVNECTLTPGTDVIIGRGSHCDVTLDHPKVSRQHVRLTHDGTDWQCTVLSKFGHIIVNTHAVENFSLTDGVTFSIPPFDLKFELETSAAATREATESGDKTFSLAGNPQEFSEKTKTSASLLKVVIKRLGEQGQVVEEIALGQETLVAGRSSKTGLKLNDPVASRKHFSVLYDGENYNIEDAGAANKTYVNGAPLTHSLILQSGDTISVGKEQFIFEVRNTEFENLPMVVSESLPAIVDHGHGQNLGQIYGQGGPAVIRIDPNLAQYEHGGANQWSRPQDGNKSKIGFLGDKRVKVSLIAILLTILGFQFFSGEKPKPSPRSLASSSIKMTGDGQNMAFEKLGSEQRKFIEETYNLALNLYTTGKYDLAAIEIQKIFQLVNNYKDARNIQALCQQALEIKKQQDDAERVRREQDSLKAKVNEILDNCENLIRKGKYAQVDNCVGQVNELDPENDRAKNLIATAHDYADQIATSKEAKAEATRHKALAIKLYKASTKDYQENRFKEAAAGFAQIQRLSFNDTINLKAKAKLGEQSSRAQIQKQADTWVREAKQALDSKDFGTAMQKFNKALAYVPRNPAAIDGREQAQRELITEMKNIYSESVIEENLGNIESAKKKWRSILKTDSRGGQYYDKARLKLQKYER